MSNQLPNDPRTDIDDAIKHRRTEDNLGVLWVWMGIFKERIKILEYKVEKDNNILYDLKCRMNSNNERLEYRLVQIEKQIEKNESKINAKAKDYWSVGAGIFISVTASIIIQLITRR